ncbi:taurine dioxygenase [Sorangium cellulosum]|uniref:Taurine dioxygenase n=1 Tax=Sorangium cellulosum TaxID=56 RepID=A0A2L0EYT9_SORCE|nr:TauD/TfdA family dioxygenase [Sorangium cellulosum]AUX44463.1 taurine dioxygenase [Sorangium cellulosum]
MSTTMRPLSKYFGVELVGFDARRDAGAGAGAELLDLLLRHQLLLLRDQELTPAELVGVGRSMGPIQPFLLSNYRHPEFDEILVTSNEKVNGKPIGVARVGNFWHSDSSYIERPANTTLLHAVKVPPTGGDTLFASMYLALDELSPELRAALEGRVAVHTIRKRYKVTAQDVGQSLREIDDRLRITIPDVTHPVVREHPLTGRPALYISEGYTLSFEGMGWEQSQKMLEELHAHATRESTLYRHHWRVGDILIWDNPSLIHAAMPSDPELPRTMHRLSIASGASGEAR